MTEQEPSQNERTRYLSYEECRSGEELSCALAGRILENLERIGKETGVSLSVRGTRIRMESPDEESLRSAEGIVKHLIALVREKDSALTEADIDSSLHFYRSPEGGKDLKSLYACKLRFRNQEIVPRTINQKKYLEAMSSSDLVFALGPAGTGKTYLAVAMAVSMILSGKRERLILARPAVEAGENLGFLPGKLEDKINPYLRPLHDALREILGPANLDSMFEKGIIELAPLAFMRGRTLNHSFIILDEAQNATDDQMLMFLTRMGFDSQCVVAGDPSQTDLPSRQQSGLVKAIRKLSGINGIRVCSFSRQDVMRHTLVEKIVQVYESKED